MSQLLSVNSALFIHNYTPSTGFAVLCVFITLVFLYLKKREVAIIFFTSFSTTAVTIFILKYLFAVPRPTDALLQLNSYAFPSSHAALSMFLATSLTWVFLFQTKIPKLGATIISILLYIIALIIGLSRLTLHVHTPLQVSVGFALGILIPTILILYTNKYRFIREKS